MERRYLFLCIVLSVLISLACLNSNFPAEVIANAQQRTSLLQDKSEICGTYFLRGLPDTYIVLKEDGTSLYVDKNGFEGWYDLQIGRRQPSLPWLGSNTSEEQNDGRIPVLVGTWEMINNDTLLTVVVYKEGFGIGREFKIIENGLLDARKRFWSRDVISETLLESLFSTIRSYFEAVAEGDYLKAKSYIEPSHPDRFTVDVFEELKQLQAGKGEIKNIYVEGKTIKNGEECIEFEVEFENRTKTSCWLSSEDGTEWKLSLEGIPEEKTSEEVMKIQRRIKEQVKDIIPEITTKNAK